MMVKTIILWLFVGLHLSVLGQEQQLVRFVSKPASFNQYYISIPGPDSLIAYNFQPRRGADSLVRPIMQEIKTLLDMTCPGRSDSLRFSIFITYDRNGEVRDIAYMIKEYDMACFNQEIYVGIYNAFVTISRTIPMAALIDSYWARPGMPKVRKSGNSMLMFKYNSKTPSNYW